MLNKQDGNWKKVVCFTGILVTWFSTYSLHKRNKESAVYRICRCSPTIYTTLSLIEKKRQYYKNTVISKLLTQSIIDLPILSLDVYHGIPYLTRLWLYLHEDQQVKQSIIQIGRKEWVGMNYVDQDNSRKKIMFNPGTISIAIQNYSFFPVLPMQHQPIHIFAHWECSDTCCKSN